MRLLRDWWRPPELPDADDARKARLLMSVLRTMTWLAAAAFALSFLDPANDRRITLVFYAPVFAGLAALAAVARRGHVVGAAWALSLGFWILIAGVLPLFGGMHGHNGAVFAVSITIIGTFVGRGPALFLAGLASVWALVVAYLEAHDALPAQLGVYTPMNAWSALTLTLLLTTVLVQGTLESLRALHERAEASALERDAALRRSIHSQKMEVVGTLTSGIAHDFNNLLTIMAGAADHLREHLAGDAESLDVIDDLESATLRARLITRQLLAFGRAEDAIEPVDVSALVASLGAMLPRLLGASIEVAVESEPGIWVQATRAGLEQILLNLAVNARDAMPEGGRLMITARTDASSVVIRVADTGVGIDEATRSRMFEAFFTTKRTGTGLGLATVKSLVDRFGGQITVDGVRGEGTRFDITLARAAGPATGAPSGTRRPPPGAPREGRALLVEDDPLVRRTTARVLASLGYEVVPVSNAREAMALLEPARTFAVVVSDISMPGLQGDALARRIAALYPDQPVVLYSGNQQPAEPASPHRSFVAKPITREGLASAIAEAQREPEKAGS